jgi:hypothetical protein
LVAAMGSGVVFLLNAVSFLAVMLVIHRWKPSPAARHYAARTYLRSNARRSSATCGTRPELRAAFLRTGDLYRICKRALGTFAIAGQVRSGPRLIRLWRPAWLHWRRGPSSGAAFLPAVRQRSVRTICSLSGPTVLFSGRYDCPGSRARTRHSRRSDDTGRR